MLELCVSQGRRVILVVAALIILPALVVADPASDSVLLKLLPDVVGGFKSAGPVTGVVQKTIPDAGSAAHLSRVYQSDDGARYQVELTTTVSETEAFSLLTKAR